MWRNLNPSQKTALGLAALILVVLLVIAVRSAGTPHYVQLYGNLTAEDAADVVKKLQEQKVPYRLVSGGNSIEVPQEKVDELRLNMAGEGLPRGGNIGFELFNQAQIGQSEFGERLNYLRALQGELSRTIMQLRSVRSARVHLALPEHRLYSDEQEKPTATVVLGLRGPDLTANEIKSIVNLVASAVVGLQPANVTVVDTNNNLLSEMLDIAGGGATSVRLQAQRTLGRQMEQTVQSMLDRVLGPNKAVVRANVKLNYDHKTIQREVYTPTSNQQGIVESEHRSSESYTGRPARVGGPIGVVPNIAPTSAVSSSSSATNGSYTRSEDSTQYRISKSVEEVEVSPGQIERVSLALFVDEGIEEGQLDTLKKTVGTAIGIDIARGDAIEIQKMKFDRSTSIAEEKEAKQTARTAMLFMLGKYVGSALLLVIFLLVISSIVRRTLAPAKPVTLPAHLHEPALAEIEDTPLSLQEPLPPMLEEATENVISEWPEEAPLPQAAPMASLPSDVETEYDFSQVDPKRVAVVIREMLAEDV